MTFPIVFFRSMQVEDIDSVMEVDRLSFSLPWPRTSYRFELEQNDASSCWVAEVKMPEGEQKLIGFAIVWLLVDQAHIASIAVHPEFRGQGIGKQLLFFILEKARQDGMLSATLEVRQSNQVAQTLYRKFGFEVTGRRLRYYHDTQEDGLIMTLLFPIPSQVRLSLQGEWNEF